MVMKFFLIASAMLAIGFYSTAKEYYKGNLTDTVFSKNNKYAIVGDLILNEESLDDGPFEGYHNSPTAKIKLKLLLNTNGSYQTINEYELATSIFYCYGVDCKLFITNNGRYIVKEVREYAPIKGESLISLNWEVFKLENDRVEECKASSSHRFSFGLANLIALYPNEWIRFMSDYTFFYDKNIESDFFLSIDVNDNIDIFLSYYSIVEKRYVETEMTLMLENLCFKIDSNIKTLNCQRNFP